MKTPSVFKFNTSYAYRKASAFGLVLGLVFLTSCAGNLFLPFNKFARTPQPTLGTQPPVNPPAQKDFLEQTFAGYQGWFTTQGLSFNNNWTHWAGSSSPSPTNITFELYPDVSEYSISDTTLTQLGNLGNGLQSRLFASDRDGVVDVHFRWMYEYGVDGVALQRFVSELSNATYRELRNRMALKVKAHAEKWARSFYLEYDISGSNESTLLSDIQNDWTTLEPQLINSSRYARRNGKPVIALWGFGFTDRPGTTSQAQQLITWFRGKGFYVIGGVPYQWRSENGSSKPGWLATYLSYDMIQPWAVGSYSSVASLQNTHLAIQLSDKQLCDQHGRQYQRVIFPGFAWSNWNGGTPNMIPRNGGDFMWKQAFFAKQLGVTAFIAMFDEYDEATAIAKAAENASMRPAAQNFLTLDADGFSLSSDFYLRLTREATKMLNGDQTYSSTVPITHR